jgi:hypothetical protein
VIGLRPGVLQYQPEIQPMKTKLAAFFAAALFAGSFAISTAQAYDEFSQCMAACRQQYRLCLQYTPDKAVLCAQFNRQCQIDCGVLN